MVDNIAYSTPRHHPVWMAIKTLQTQSRCLFPVLLCFGMSLSVAMTLPAIADAAPNNISDSQEAPALGKRMHLRHPVSARVPPYQAIGRLIGPMNCTGAIVLHPRIVVTAAHCVVGLTAAGPPRRIFFERWSQVAGGIRSFEVTIKAVGSVHQYGPQSVHDASQDWAVLLLNETPSGVRPLDIAEYSLPELQSKRGRIFLPAYARDGDESTLVSVDLSCSIGGVQWEVLVHDCSGGVTGSGAPLLIDDGDCYRIVGIHSGTMMREADDGSDTLKPIGNSAVGAWNFAAPVRALARQLEASEVRASPDRGPSDACSMEMAGSGARSRPSGPSSESGAPKRRASLQIVDKSKVI